MLQSAKALTLMAEQGLQDWTTVKLVKKRVAESDEDEYQGVTVPNFDSCLEECKVHVLADFHRLEEKIRQCLEWSDTKLLGSILVFIETQSWVQKEGDGDEGRGGKREGKRREGKREGKREGEVKREGKGRGGRKLNKIEVFARRFLESDTG